jgi:hypothetical protein
MWCVTALHPELLPLLVLSVLLSGGLSPPGLLIPPCVMVTEQNASVHLRLSVLTRMFSPWAWRV